MELFFAYIAGLLTLINPCVLPILPIVVASSLSADTRGPLYLAAGLSLSFVVFGVGVTAFGRSVGLTPDRLSEMGAYVMVMFGLLLVLPQSTAWFTARLSGAAARADRKIDHVQSRGALGQMIAGALLGVVWSPCIGPTLGGAIALASQGENLTWASWIMIFFALGVSTIILALAYGARATLQRRQTMLRRLATASKPILGGAFIVVGVALIFKAHHYVDAALLESLPYWLTDLSVRF